MRIVDRRKDYYDGVQGMGQDMGLTYIRTPKKERFNPENSWVKSDLPHWPFPRFRGLYWRPGLGVQDIVIGFCGKIYPCLRVWNLSRPGSDSVFVNDLKSFDDAVLGLGFSDPEVETYMESRWVKATRQWQKRLAGRGTFPFRKDVERFFGPEGYQREADKHAKLFEDHLSPVFVATCQEGWGSEGKVIEYNALLRPYDFMRVFDPYSAYQEISMYLGNMAFPNRPIPHVSDEDMAAAKGFDKFSFRKDPKRSKR